MLRSRLTYILSIMIIFYVALGCSVEKRIHKAETLLSEKNKLAEICAVRFPLKDSIAYRDSIKFDTLYEGIYSVDTVYDNDTVKVYLTLPAKVVTKEVVKYRDIYRENTSKIVDCQKKSGELVNKVIYNEREIEKLRSELSKSQALAKQRWWFLWILVVLAVAIIFRKSIFKLSGKLMRL